MSRVAEVLRSFSFSISPSNEHPGLVSFRMDWLDLLAVQGTLKSLLQHHSSKASILLHSAFFMVQLSYPYMIGRVYHAKCQTGIKLAERNINYLRYADDTTFMAENEEELKSLLMKVRVKKLAENSTFRKLRSWHPVPSLHGK